MTANKWGEGPSSGKSRLQRSEKPVSMKLRRRLWVALVLFVLLTIAGAVHSLWTIHAMHENQQAVESAARTSQHFERMFERAEHYQSVAPRDWQAFSRDIETYYSSLRDDMITMDRLTATLAYHVPQFATVLWGDFRDGLTEQIGTDPKRPRLEWASRFITDESGLLAAALQLAENSVTAAALKSRQRMWTASVLLALATLSLALMLAGIFRYQVFRRIEETSQAVRKISDGQFTKIRSKGADDELGRLEEDVRDLSRRNQDLVDLLDILNGADSLSSAIKHLPARMIQQFSLSWMGLLELQDERIRLRLSHPENEKAAFEEPACGWPLDGSLFDRCREGGRTICEKLKSDVVTSRDPLMRRLCDAGFASVALLPVWRKDRVVACIILASRRQEAFDRWRGRWLGNVGHLLAHAVYRTHAHEESELANRAKSNFISSMTHELRTPMNAILGFGQLLEMDDSLSDENKDNVREIIQAGNHLLELINEVLDLAKIESGHMKLSLAPTLLLPVIEECVHLTSSLAEKRSIRVCHRCAPGIKVSADRIRLKQALLNLLSNAIKYNRDGGSVQIEAKSIDARRLRILVSDSGRGIPKDKLTELFQPFNRMNAETSGIEGTGIGLTITRRIVELMGGSVEVDSELGRGSTFYFDLSLATQIENNNASRDRPTVQILGGQYTHQPGTKVDML